MVKKRKGKRKSKYSLREKYVKKNIVIILYQIYQLWIKQIH